MRIEGGNLVTVVCDENTEKGFWQGFMSKIGAILFFEDNGKDSLTERYLYYDSKNGVVFDIQYTKK